MCGPRDATTVVVMTSTRISLLASSAAVVLWGLKGVAIGAAGGLGRSPAEGPFFLTGLVAMVVAASALGLAVTTGRHRALRVAAAVLGPFLGAALAGLVDAGIRVFLPLTDDRPWVWNELNLWVLAVVGLALALRLDREGTASRPSWSAVPAA
jgi:hypothetical protein